jgi:hypothetical protein
MVPVVVPAMINVSRIRGRIVPGALFTNACRSWVDWMSYGNFVHPEIF